jgi:hypothetical protein
MSDETRPVSLPDWADVTPSGNRERPVTRRDLHEFMQESSRRVSVKLERHSRTGWLKTALGLLVSAIAAIGGGYAAARTLFLSTADAREMQREADSDHATLRQVDAVVDQRLTRTERAVESMAGAIKSLEHNVIRIGERLEVRGLRRSPEEE